MNDSAIDYSKVLTELIQKQMVLIGPDITFGIVKKVGSLHVDQNGVVMQIDTSDPRTLLTNLLNEFFSLSELIAKRSVEILLENYPELPIDPKSYGVTKKVELPPALSGNTQAVAMPLAKEEKKVFVPQAGEQKPVPILEKPTVRSQPQIITPKGVETPQPLPPPVTPSRPSPGSAFTPPLHKEPFFTKASKDEEKKAAPVGGQDVPPQRPTMQKEDLPAGRQVLAPVIVEAEKKPTPQPIVSELTPLNSDEEEQVAAKKINELFTTNE